MQRTRESSEDAIAWRARETALLRSHAIVLSTQSRLRPATIACLAALSRASHALASAATPPSLRAGLVAAPLRSVEWRGYSKLMLGLGLQDPDDQKDSGNLGF
jgi:hypothetical protein